MVDTREELDRQFRRLHKESIEDFEEKVRHRREEAARMVAEQKQLQRQELQHTARLLDLPVDRLHRLSREEEAAMKSRAAEAQQTLAAQDARRALAFEAAIHPALALPGARSVPILASNIMASNQADVASIPGERGNPWVLPWNPGHITIKQELLDTEYGLCGWARPHINDPIVVDVYFAFLSDTFANWQFLVFADFHGFYVLNAVRGFLLCRDSRVTLDASLDVYQYFWFGQQSTSLIDEDSDTGLRYGDYNESQMFSYSAPLRADSTYYVFVRLRITMHATAYGGFALIDFADGPNYINPILLIAWPG